MNFFGIDAFPRFIESLEMLMCFAEIIFRIALIKANTSPTNIPLFALNGAATTQTAGMKRISGKKDATRGYCHSRYSPEIFCLEVMNLDYAQFLMKDLQVLLVTSGDVPTYSHPGDAGADLRSAEALTIPPGERRTVGTGVAIALPDGYVGLVHPRSGLAAKHGITVLNAPGTVDAGYRGEIRVTLLNTDLNQAFEIAIGDRIAQLVIQGVEKAHFMQVDRLPESNRGEGGFGSTGVK